MVFACFWGHVQGQTLTSHKGIVCFSSKGQAFETALSSRSILGSSFGPLGPYSTSFWAALKDLMLKVVFVVVICPACHVSELQALSCREPYLVLAKEKVVLHPVLSFLPKVMSVFHLNQVVALLAFGSPETAESRSLHLLDVCRSLKRYLRVTEVFRCLKLLFVLFGGPSKGEAASKASIFHWIWEAIESAYLLKR